MDSLNKISVVINTLNEEQNIKRALDSVRWADEVIVCDMHSEDATVEIAKKMGAKIFLHKRTGYVEPARNFAISKAAYSWILILDADEQVLAPLANYLREIIKTENAPDYIKIPRKNLIFGKWMKTSMWWPDYNIRFFKAGKVIWSDRIHIQPEAIGKDMELSAEEDMAIIHHHYSSISQFIRRMDVYSTIQANELVASGYKLQWVHLIEKPIDEFLARFFNKQGYKDGLHGFVLGFLQAISFLVVYLKVWEIEGFKETDISLNTLKKVNEESNKKIKYWFWYSTLSKNKLRQLMQRIKYKVNR